MRLFRRHNNGAEIFISALFTVVFLCLYNSNVQANISKDVAKERIITEILHNDTSDVSVSMSADPISSSTNVASWTKEILSPYEESWFFFIDDHPLANWGHPCRYVFVDAETGQYLVVNETSPPTVNCGMENVISNVEFGQGSTEQSIFNISDSGPSAIADSRKYAVLINGGYDARNNFSRYWNDLSAIYTTLVQRYGYLEEHIYVFCSDGINPELDQNQGTLDNPIFVDSNPDLDQDGDDDIDYSASLSNVDMVFQHLQEVLISADQLFIFITDHGSQTKKNTSQVSAALWNGEFLTDSHLADLVDSINCSGIIFTFESCYSGGFVVESDGSPGDVMAPNRVASSACRWDQFSASIDGVYNEFVYHWTAAVRGCYPGANPWEPGNPVDADVNDDKSVSIKEAFGYAKAHDRCSEEPQYNEIPSGLGERMFLGSAATFITKSLQLLQSPPYYVGDTITATFTIKNKGAAPITFKVLTVGGRLDGECPGDKCPDFEFHHDITLNPDASYDYRGNLTLAQPGNYHFFCAYQTPDDQWNTAIPTEPGVINTLDIVVEPSETPDLTITSVTAPTSSIPGDSINVSFTVKNQGGAPSGAFHNRISLATTPWGTDILLGNFSMDSIAAGSSLSDTKNVKIPDTVSPGDYYVTVFTDCYQVINESNEDNNIGSTYPNTISIGPTDTTPPTIITKIPEANATNVPITTNIQVTFSEPMNKSATESAFSITPSVAGSMSWQGNTFVFNPSADLEYKKTYTVIITSSATDLAGNPLAHTEWSFTTKEEGTECFWADLDCDEDVDTEDVRIIAIYWDTQVGDPLYDAQYDFNSDGRINLLDVRMVAQHWGQTAPFDTAAPSIVQINSNPREVIAYLQENLPEVRIGEITTVEEKFQGMELHLSYDSQKLKATYAGLEKRYSFIILGPRINQKQGTVAIGAVLLGKQEIFALTSEILSAVKFTAQQERDSAPHTFALGQNFPNPFNPDTWIPYQLAESSNVQIKIYNVSGQLIRALDLGYKEAGYYQNKASATYWDGRNEFGEKPASGVYFYTIKTGNFTATRKMLLIE